MAVIINIETSGKKCSVSVGIDGMVQFHKEDSDEMNHSVSLAPFVKDCMDYIKRNDLTLDAVAVSLGPGSYTGLRIGMSLAKGLAFSLSIPLIGVSTLKLIAVKAMFKDPDWQGTETVIAMSDARRMEVYAGGFNARLQEVLKEQPVILDQESFKDFHGVEKVVFAGDGCEKFKNIYSGSNALWLPEALADALVMAPLTEMEWQAGNFIDIAYSVPNYLKQYQTTVPKNKVFNNIKK